MNDGLDVDRVAAQAEALGLVSPDMQGPEEDGDSDEVLVLIHISGGLLADVGCRRRDIARLRVVVVDEDVVEDDPERASWTETPTAVEEWPVGPTDPLSRARTELPDDLIAELHIPDLPPCPTEDDG